MEEVSKLYTIPIPVLKAYESWGLCDEVKKVLGQWEYDERDIERLSMIMTLHDIGFEKAEIAKYMELMMGGDATCVERQCMLNQKRHTALDAMHFQQKCIDRIDYLKYEMRKGREK